MKFERLSDINIKENIGQRVYITALIKGVDIRATKTGQDSIVFTMVDRDNERECRGFEVTKGLRDKTADTSGKLFDIMADIKPYDKGTDGVSCILYDMRVHEGSLSPDDFINIVPNLQLYVNNITGLVSMISDTAYGQIVARILNKYWAKFTRYPAAKSVHHNLLGGLVMHTFCVANSCINMYNTYSSIYGSDCINYSLLIAAALIHDVGKCNEYEVDGFGNVAYSTHATMSTHITDIIAEVNIAAHELGLEGMDEVLELQHCVAAHHGKLEWGSPIKPSTIEAMILHEADMIDAEMWQFTKNAEKLSIGESKTEWAGSEMRSFYRGMTRENAITNFSIACASNEED